MRRGAFRLGALVGALGLAAAVAPLATAKVGAVYPGPLGLDWGKSPPEARSILQGKLTFVSEAPSGEAPYDTVDQHYSGVFGGLKVVDVMLRFYRGEFFYMLVKLVVPQVEGEVASPSRVFQMVVDRMRKQYGEPKGLYPPRRLAPPTANYENLPLADAEKAGLPVLWNEQSRADPVALARLRDKQIELGHWDPFADWRFRNQVIVQTFLWQEVDKLSGKAGPLVPVWIFCKEDRFRIWRSAVRTAQIIEPRDF